MPSKKKTLAAEIEHGFVESKFDTVGSKFLPAGLLQSLVNRNNIDKKLKSDSLASDSERADLFNFIHNEAPRIFLIMAHMDAFHGPKFAQAMRLFKGNGFTDAKLPAPPWVEGKTHLFELYEGTEEDNDDDDTDDDNGLWVGKHDRINKFYASQERFRAPILTPSVTNVDLSEYATLPFTFKGKANDKGAFSEVYQIVIHPDHYHDAGLKTPSGSSSTRFALKQLKDDPNNVEMNWGQEVSAHKRMNSVIGPDQQHVVRFITAFRRGTKDHCLIFEWADGGSLRDLWVKTERPELTGNLIQHAISQFLGLTKALCAVHNLDGKGSSVRHGDLKPDNILRFPDGTELGTLKIGDWGLAKHHNLATRLRTKVTSTRHGTLRYEPPEAAPDIPTAGSQAPGRSRLYDIWSMGIIILEFLIWLLYGTGELTRFNERVQGESQYETPCYQFIQEGQVRKPKLHRVVTLWMDHLAKHPACKVDTPLGDLLSLVREKLLVVALPAGLGQPGASPRIGADGAAGAQHPITIEVTAAANEGNPPVASLQRQDSTEPVRALATIFRDDLEAIASGGHNKRDDYWSKGLAAIAGRMFQGPRDQSKPESQDGLQPPKELAIRGKQEKERPKESSAAIGLGVAPPQQRTSASQNLDTLR